MPNSPRSLAITDTYRARLAAIRERLDRTADETFPPTDALDADEWPDRMAAIVAQAQAEAVRASAGYLTAFLSSELRTPVRGPELSSADYSGMTTSGRDPAEQLRSVFLGAWAEFRQGVDPDEARDRALMRAKRMIEMNLMAAARGSLHEAIRDDDRIVGWHRAIRGTCDQCVGAEAAEGYMSAGAEMMIHPNCQCVSEPVIDDSDDRYRRQRAQDRFDAMTKGEQDAYLGTEKAMAVRNDLVQLDDLVDDAGEVLRSKRLSSLLDDIQQSRLAEWVRRRRAALKAWETRKLNLKRSLAAKKAWATRRLNALVQQPSCAPDSSMATSIIDDIQPFGGGGHVNDTWSGVLDDGIEVILKYPNPANMRSNLDDLAGLDHARAAERIARFLGVDTPRVYVIDDVDEIIRRVGASNWDDFGQPDRLILQEMVQNMGSANGRTVARVDAENWSILDCVIGNADRHPHQWGRIRAPFEVVGSPPRIVALDHDLTFPYGPTEGNFFRWKDAAGNELAGQHLPARIISKLDGMIRNERGWREAMRRDGLSPREIESAWERIHHLRRSRRFPHPEDWLGGGIQEWPQRFR